MDALKVSLQDIARATGESLPTIYAAMKAGHLDTFLVGRRRFARPDAVRAWMDLLERRSAAGKPVVYRSRESEERAAAPEPKVRRSDSRLLALMATGVTQGDAARVLRVNRSTVIRNLERLRQAGLYLPPKAGGRKIAKDLPQVNTPEQLLAAAAEALLNAHKAIVELQGWMMWRGHSENDTAG